MHSIYSVGDWAEACLVGLVFVDIANLVAAVVSVEEGTDTLVEALKASIIEVAKELDAATMTGRGDVRLTPFGKCHEDRMPEDLVG